MNNEGPVILESDKDAVIQMLEGTKRYREIIERITETRDEEYWMQCFKEELPEKSWLDEEHMKMLEWEVRWAVEERRQGRGEEQEQEVLGGHDQQEGKGGGFGRKGKQQELRTRKDEEEGEEQELGRVAPDVGYGGSHPQAMSDPEKEGEEATRENEGKGERQRKVNNSAMRTRKRFRSC